VCIHVFSFDVVRSFHVGFDLEKRVYLKYDVSWVFGICKCNNNTILYKQPRYVSFVRCTCEKRLYHTVILLNVICKKVFVVKTTVINIRNTYTWMFTGEAYYSCVLVLSYLYSQLRYCYCCHRRRCYWKILTKTLYKICSMHPVIKKCHFCL